MRIGRIALKLALQSKPRLIQRGFTYIGVLVLITVMMITMGAVSQVWHAVMQRENEKELLFIGHQFRNAIGNYYKYSGRRFPPSMDALLGTDNNQVKLPRYLRRIYRDPMTGDHQWGVVLGLNGEIVGVHSLSEDSPYKTSGFSDADIDFEGAEKYSDWKFIYVPKLANSRQGGTVNGIVRPVPRVSK
jgi:type II secretory pathway pseudopilin PulG